MYPRLLLIVLTEGRVVFLAGFGGRLSREIPETAARRGHLTKEVLKVALIEVVRHEYDRETRVPSAFVIESAIVASKAYEAWVKAKEESDFSIFRPHLEKIVALKQRYVSFFPSSEHPYDVLLDQFERGMKTADVQTIFNNLRPQQIELLQAISEKEQVGDDFLKVEYDNKMMAACDRNQPSYYGLIMMPDRSRWTMPGNCCPMCS